MPGGRLTFEFDRRRSASNLSKHGISFVEAMSMFRDPLAATLPDDDHSSGEARLITIGESEKHRILYVVHTEVGNTIRLISARLATSTEKKQYEEE